ncbi:hypothetical protein ACFVXE_01635 [Streptomyces sp. NPDC058231]|uniref:hypothetical protein n=1 Tax=Streptomyces sp. NPDC058231 TaxID=3346392 RepID=UPI0036F0B157
MPVRSRRAAQGKAPVPGAGVHDADRNRAARATADGHWLVLGKDGRLSAYAPCDGGLLRWTETRPGGPGWAGPDFFPVANLTHLSVTQGTDGFVHLIGRRTVRKDDGPVVDVVHATQFQSGRPVTEWRSVGNPHKDREKAARLGAPTAAVGAGGLLHVFARNADGKLALRREKTGGKWEGWQDLKGGRLQDGAAAVATASGRVEVLVPGQGMTMRWGQNEPSGAFAQDQDIPFAHLPGSATALETAPERVTYYWADEATGGIVALRPGTWAIPLNSSPSYGPVAALRAMLDGYDCTVLAHRDQEGQVMLTACGTENEGAGVWWSPTGERCVGGPALAYDAYGRVVLALVGEDGALRVARQSREPGLALEHSVRV